MFRCLCFTATIVAFASPAAAAEPGRVAVQAHIPLADIVANDMTARRTFDARVSRFARRACGGGDGSLSDFADRQRCRREMMEDAHRQLADLQRRGGTQLALAPR